MGYIDSLLGRNERIIFSTRQHWIQLLLPGIYMLLIVAVLIVAGAVAYPFTTGISMIAAIVLSLIPIGLFVRRFTWWWYEQYLVTNRRVIQIEGVFDRHVIDSSLEKVNDVVLTQSAAGRLFGYGDIEIMTGSEIGVNKLGRIHQPIRFKTEMLNQKEGMGEIDAFESRSKRVLSSQAPDSGDVPELIAELDELRVKGILTQEEFDKKKQDLLNRL